MMFTALLVLAAHTASAAQDCATGIGSMLLQSRVSLGATDAVHDDSVEVGRSDGSQQMEDDIVLLSNLAQSAGSNAAGSLATLTAAKKITGRMLHRVGNATEHMTPAHQTHLQTVLNIINATIFISMDAGHKEDQQELNHAAHAVDAVNAGYASFRLAGDIIHERARAHQMNITRLKGPYAILGEEDSSTWNLLKTFMEGMATGPKSPLLPSSRTTLSLDNFFASNDYILWYNTAKSLYDAKRAAFNNAHMALVSLQSQLNSTRTSLVAEYCAWKVTLESGCAKFNIDYKNKTGEFEIIDGRLQNSMQGRIDTYKAGKMIESHIKYLLGSASFDEKMTVTDTSRYELITPTFQEQTYWGLLDDVCNLAALTDDFWKPSISCGGPDEVSGYWMSSDRMSAV